MWISFLMILAISSPKILRKYRGEPEEISGKGKRTYVSYFQHIFLVLILHKVSIFEEVMVAENKRREKAENLNYFNSLHFYY